MERGHHPHSLVQRLLTTEAYYQNQDSDSSGCHTMPKTNQESDGLSEKGYVTDGSDISNTHRPDRYRRLRCKRDRDRQAKRVNSWRSYGSDTTIDDEFLENFKGFKKQYFPRKKNKNVQNRNALARRKSSTDSGISLLKPLLAQNAHASKCQKEEFDNEDCRLQFHSQKQQRQVTEIGELSCINTHRRYSRAMDNSDAKLSTDQGQDAPIKLLELSKEAVKILKSYDTANYGLSHAYPSSYNVLKQVTPVNSYAREIRRKSAQLFHRELQNLKDITSERVTRRHSQGYDPPQAIKNAGNQIRRKSDNIEGTCSSLKVHPSSQHQKKIDSSNLDCEKSNKRKDTRHYMLDKNVEFPAVQVSERDTSDHGSHIRQSLPPGGNQQERKVKDRQIVHLNCETSSCQNRERDGQVDIHSSEMNLNIYKSLSRQEFYWSTTEHSKPRKKCRWFQELFRRHKLKTVSMEGDINSKAQKRSCQPTSFSGPPVTRRRSNAALVSKLVPTFLKRRFLSTDNLHEASREHFLGERQFIKVDPLQNDSNGDDKDLRESCLSKYLSCTDLASSQHSFLELEDAQLSCKRNAKTHCQPVPKRSQSCIDLQQPIQSQESSYQETEESCCNFNGSKQFCCSVTSIPTDARSRTNQKRSCCLNCDSVLSRSNSFTCTQQELNSILPPLKISMLHERRAEKRSLKRTKAQLISYV